MTPPAQRRRAERAFERLYRRYVGDVYRYALVLLRNPEDAEDVTQATFLNAYRSFRSGARHENPHSWLIGIAHDICRQRLRLEARRPVEVDFDEDHALEAIPEEVSPTALEIRRALEHLPLNQRAALIMRELEGRTYAEIAEVLVLAPAAVETMIFRARRALREHLEGTLTCHEAERALSKEVDGMLPRSERGSLRAHLEVCDDCASFARSMQTQRAAWKALAAVPLPTSLDSFFGPSGVAERSRMAAAHAAVVTGLRPNSVGR